MRSHANIILKFFGEQEKKGILLTRDKELKKWAREVHISPTTLHKELKTLVLWGYLIREEKVVRGRLGVFYGINDNFREWWITQIRTLEQKSRQIEKLEKREKIEALKKLVSSTMAKFLDFVPFYIHHLLQNETKINDLTESLDTFWNWCLYPFMFVTAQACLRDKEIVSEFEAIKSIEKGYQEYLKSDFYRSLRKEGIMP